MTLPARAASFVLVAIALVLVAGCDELSARRLVQKGNEDYSEQRYEAAAEKFEAALRKVPNLDIAHHNLAIAYTRMFKPGVETPANKAIADKAATHFAVWLETHPDDEKIRRLLTGLWIDSGDYPKAIEFWKKEHEKNPKARDVITLVAGIYLKSGDWRSALEWYEKDVEAAVDVPGKVVAWNSIANLAYGKVFGKRETLYGVERTEISEIGLHAAGEALKLDPTHIPSWGISTQLWKNHGLANGPSWAIAIDDAEAQVYDQQARVLKEAAKKAQAAGGAGGAPPAAPGNGT
jgi:tetratricopeptide (TPR) repeat protein